MRYFFAVARRNLLSYTLSLVSVLCFLHTVSWAAAPCPIIPTGLILQRWTDLGFVMGCPTGPEVPVVDGQGTRMPFSAGEIVTSPGQGPKMVVAAYQAENSIIVNWGDSDPFNYDFFIVRWDLNGRNIGQFDVREYVDRTFGFFHIPSPSPGHYTIVVEGCDDGAVGSDCKQKFTAPVAVDYTLPNVPNYACTFGAEHSKPTGWIAQKWADVGGGDRAIGCPTDNEHPVPGRNGSISTFKGGQIAFSPDQGDAMAVAIYYENEQIFLDWGSSAPFSYDKWIVRIDRDGQNILQTDTGARLGGHWSMSVSDHMDAPHQYTAIVEGCDTGGRSTCRQGWTIPVTVSVARRLDTPADCAFLPSQPILDRWKALGGSAGVLGCPTGAEVTLPSKDRVVQFLHGQMVFSPKQGDKMVVAIYQQGEDVVVNWGDSFPFHYDKFLLRFDRDGLNLGQIDIDGGPPSSGKFVFHNSRPENESKTIIVDSAGTYGVTVEGCDVGVFTGTTCKQHWTTAAFVNYQPFGSFMLESKLMFIPPLTPPTTLDEAKKGESVRAYAASFFAACGPVIADVNSDPDGFVQQVIAKLVHYTFFPIDSRHEYCAGSRWNMREEVNVLLREQEVASNTGTSCKGRGDYDVALKGYIAIYYRFGVVTIEPDVRYHLRHLLNKKGPHDPADDSVCIIDVPETENHKLMIESSRYLTNQILHATSGDPSFDNSRNGMDEFILLKLQSFLKHDFIEYNSRPYERYSVVAIQNLYDYAQNDKVHTAARIILDYLAAKLAVSSNELLRDPPYRRRVSHSHPDLLHPQSDPLKDRFIFYLGPTPVMKDVFPSFSIKWSAAGEMVMAAISSYRPADLILDLMINPTHRSFYQRLLHSTIEVYSSEPDFLITASGLPAPYAYTVLGHGDQEDLGIVPPTFLMPTGQFTSPNQMIRVDEIGSDMFGGSPFGNLCVAPGFACGEHPTVPDIYLPSDRTQCWIVQGDWTFVDFATHECKDLSGNGEQFGFYAAIYGRGQRFGFFEAVPKAKVVGVSLQQFATKILTQNSGHQFTEGFESAYTRFSGTDVRFNPPGNFQDNPIKATGVPEADKLLFNSPFKYGELFALGSILNTTDLGAIQIVNTSLAQVLNLDLRDINHPIWDLH
jgi:uncharacterized protein YodC (DUF2158 family)